MIASRMADWPGAKIFLGPSKQGQLLFSTVEINISKMTPIGVTAFTR